MTKRECVTHIKKQVKKVNDKIDERIYAGKSYADLSKVHKNLLFELTKLEDRK